MLDNSKLTSAELLALSLFLCSFSWFLDRIFGTPGHHSPVSTFVLCALASWRRTTMNQQHSNSWKRLQQKSLSRRTRIRGAAGTAAGAGILLGSGLRFPALAQEDAQETCPDLPRPIPHITTPPGGHFFFPGAPDGS